MKSDSDIKRDVEEELRFDPDIDATDIGVSVNNGVVALTGFVKSYTEKFEAEAAAKRVAGVLGLANDLEVRLPGGTERPDPDIARDAVAALKTRAAVHRGAHSCRRQGRLGDARRAGRVALPA